MKVLVTGGAGFIGSHLVDRLVSLGFETAVIDDLSNGRKEFVNRKSVFYKARVEDRQRISEIMSEVKPEVVFHLAAKIDVHSSLKNPADDAMTNIIGTLNLVIASAESRVKRFVFASSAAVYGVPEYLPVDETHNIKPISPYGVSKASSEWYLRIVSEDRGMDFVVLRFSNVYGPRQGTVLPSGLISIMVRSFIKGKSIDLYDPEASTRDYVYVDDVVDAMVMSIDAPASHEVINISSGKEVSNMKIYEEVSRFIEGSFVSKPLRRGEIRRIYLDNRKAKRLLNWEPKTDLREGILKTIDFFKNWKGEDR